MRLKYIPVKNIIFYSPNGAHSRDGNVRNYANLEDLKRLMQIYSPLSSQRLLKLGHKANVFTSFFLKTFTLLHSKFEIQRFWRQPLWQEEDWSKYSLWLLYGGLWLSFEICLKFTEKKGKKNTKQYKTRIKHYSNWKLNALKIKVKPVISP